MSRTSFGCSVQAGWLPIDEQDTFRSSRLPPNDHNTVSPFLPNLLAANEHDALVIRVRDPTRTYVHDHIFCRVAVGTTLDATSGALL